MALSLKSQVAEVKRELSLRARVYSRETVPKKISENELHLEHMRAVLKTLEWLHGNNVPPNLPNPGTVAAAMFYVMRLAGAVVVKPDTAKKRLAAIVEACTNALQGLPPPDQLSDAELEVAIEALHETAIDPYDKLKRMLAARRDK
jgi:hypothetical protein